ASRSSAASPTARTGPGSASRASASPRGRGTRARTRSAPRPGSRARSVVARWSTNGPRPRSRTRSTSRVRCPSGSCSCSPRSCSGLRVRRATSRSATSTCLRRAYSRSSRWFLPEPENGQNEGVVDTEQDPRVERSRRVILEAALEELGEVGYGALTIESVAARAGVGKSTIYRHWSGKLALVEDAFRTLKAVALVPETGTLRERVIGFLEQVARFIEESTYSACMPALIEAAERDPQVRTFHCDFSAERRAVLVDVLRDAISKHE